MGSNTGSCFVPGPVQASSEDSRRLYKRHGYADLETWRVRDDAPPFFFMSRAPHSVSHRLVAEE